VARQYFIFDSDQIEATTYLPISVASHK